MGLVLAGGGSTRFGSDKGSAVYHDVPQARWAVRLLSLVSPQVFVSLRPSQTTLEAYRGLPQLLDVGPGEGPAAGLAAAFERAPGCAWLVLAVDMPLVDEAMLRMLVADRDPEAVATAFRHGDGTPEPLFGLWEPRSAALLGPESGGSLRRILETSRSRLLTPPEPARLVSVNTAAHARTVRSYPGTRP
jgi:molybdopterin-guanine dinucleotide biosynthesis protein A